MTVLNMPMDNKRPIIHANNIPQMLRDFPHWLVWKYAPAKVEGGKPRKLPYYPNSGRIRRGMLGGPQDVAKLGTFADALRVARQDGFDGIGLAILPEQQDITVIDLDDCIDARGKLSEFAHDIHTSGTYVERSPSGRGLRAVYLKALSNTKHNFRLDEDGDGERVEVYCGNAYTTFTGNKLKALPGEGNLIEMPRDIKRRLMPGIQKDLSRASATTGDGGGAEDPLMPMDSKLPNMTPAQALRVLRALPDRWGAAGEGTWWRVAAALHMQFGPAKGWEVLDAWSVDRPDYDEESNRQRWDAGFSHARGKQSVTTMRNLVFEAREAGARFRAETLASWGLGRKTSEDRSKTRSRIEDGDADDDDDLLGGKGGGELSAEWESVDTSEWGAGERVPGTPALVKGWLYEGTAALFSAPGGAGKSWGALGLAALAACGTGQWFGVPVVGGDVLFVSGEDSIGEIRYRLEGTCAAYGLDVREVLAHLDIVDVTGVLHKALYTAGSDFGKTEFTEQYDQLCAKLETKPYKYLVLDNISKFYMANENIRPMVDEFISALAALATEKNMGVVLIGHDAKMGLTGYSGSTAWHNSVRTRWTLAVKEGNHDLMVEKNNYGKSGHGGRFRWDDDAHILRMGETLGPGTASADFDERLEKVQEIVLDYYENEGKKRESISASGRGPLGAITEHEWVLEKGISDKDLRMLLKKCVDQGMLGIENYKDKSRREHARYCPASLVEEDDLLGD